MYLVCPAASSTGPDCSLKPQTVSHVPVTCTFTSIGNELGLVTCTVTFWVKRFPLTNRLRENVTLPTIGAGRTLRAWDCEPWFPSLSVTVSVAVKGAALVEVWGVWGGVSGSKVPVPKLHVDVGVGSW